MSRYPIKILKVSGSTATKEYHIVRITMLEDGVFTGMVITRWGKKGKWGTGWNVATFDAPNELLRFYDKKHREKFGGEYRITTEKETDVADPAQLKRVLGPYFFKLTPDQLKYLDPDIDTTGATGTPEIEWELDAKTGRSQATQQRRMVDVIEPTKPADPKDSMAVRVYENSNWGIF